MRKTAVGIITLTTLALTGCSLIGAKNTPSTDPASQPPPSSVPSASSAPSVSSAPSASTTTSSDPSSSATAGAPAPPGSEQLGKAVASRKSALENQPIVLTLYPVVRDGATSHLNFTLAFESSSAARQNIGNLLTDANNETSDSSPWTVDGLQLIDGKNSKVYLVASDGQHNCLCSRGLLNVALEGNTPVVLSATFAAPPADVTAVDVRIPSFGTVSNVPVS